MTRRSTVWLTMAAGVIVGGCSGSITDPTGRAAGDPEAPPGHSAEPGASPSGGPGAKPAIADAPSTCGPTEVGVSPMHRLTRIEYDNTIRDLIGEDLNLSRAFNEDERAGEFSGNFFAPVNELQLGQYATAADAAAERAVARLSDLLPCQPAGDEAGCATSFIRQFGRRAHRRPLTDDEVARYQELFELGRQGAGFENGIKLVVEAMLQSPHFLYLVEGPGPLDQHQLAARMSYFLWRAPPDARLSEAADQGKLDTIEAFRAHARRLLADPRAQVMVADFHTQWLGLDKFEKLPKDAVLYPEFEALKPAMAEETHRFVAEVLKDDGRLGTLLTASYSVVDGPLAALYGAADHGADWKRVELDPAQRAGLLTQASFLAEHGALDGSSPIRRGLAVRERFLCSEVPPPPPGAEDNIPEAKPTQTTRQRFDEHRTDPSCAGCHTLMDMIGYAFESYDGIGRYRTTENGAPVDDSGAFIGTDIDGRFDGAAEMARQLAGSKQMHACLTTQWFRYAFGRLETKLDTCSLDALAKRFIESDLSIPELLVAIVESDAFRTHRSEE